jgi:disulfide oxidoreductase YuzD
MNPFNHTTKDLAKAYKWSEKTVERRVDDGTFTYGKEYIDVRAKNAKNRDLRFNLEACQKLFLTPPEKR